MAARKVEGAGVMVVVTVLVAARVATRLVVQLATQVVGAGVVGTGVVGTGVVGVGVVVGLSVTKLGENSSSVKMAGLNGQIQVHSKPAMTFF